MHVAKLKRLPTTCKWELRERKTRCSGGLGYRAQPAAELEARDIAEDWCRRISNARCSC
jgi:hypothetical protein